MTKTELLEQILAELRAIHAALETPADLPTPADDYEGMKALISTPNMYREYIPTPDGFMDITAKNNEAGRY